MGLRAKRSSLLTQHRAIFNAKIKKAKSKLGSARSAGRPATTQPVSTQRSAPINARLRVSLQRTPPRFPLEHESAREVRPTQPVSI